MKRTLDLQSNIHTKPLKKRILENWDLYLLLIIPVALLLIFSYYPMFGLQIAFRKFNASGGIWGSPWVGLDNFKRLFTTNKIVQVFINTIRISGYQILVEPIVTVTFALMLNAVFSSRYKRLVQTISYMPHFISTVVMVGILRQILNNRIGIYAIVCEQLGINAVDVWSLPEAFPHLFVWSIIWQNLGWNSIIYIAALSSVELELYEAAEIDGASRFKRLLYIDFPTILPTFAVLFILKVGSMMSIGYEQVLLMQTPLNLMYSEIISTYSYKIALEQSSDYSLGTAISLFNSVINLVLIYIANKLSKKISGIGLW
ncbi:MAG: sugar ABC transporter permease [Clostridia bacterium]|nr:sugar ABC transporter permease [Clostridia bacterium]